MFCSYHLTQIKNNDGALIRLKRKPTAPINQTEKKKPTNSSKI